MDLRTGLPHREMQFIPTTLSLQSRETRHKEVICSKSQGHVGLFTSTAGALCPCVQRLGSRSWERAPWSQHALPGHHHAKDCSNQQPHNPKGHRPVTTCWYPASPPGSWDWQVVAGLGVETKGPESLVLLP